ncbi:MAG: prepilin peptidase [Acholeplasmataceae bacterium]|nr:prepilin peptidase [Acholeplasmataceae bacterium]
MIFYIVYFIFGLFTGSILYRYIECLPERRSLTAPLTCSPCGRKLKFVGMKPLIGNSGNNGSCQSCEDPFLRRKTVIELLTAFLFVLCYISFGSTVKILNALLLTCFLIVISHIDYDYSLIPDKVLLPMAVVGVILNLFLGEIKILNMFVSAIIGGCVFLLLALISKGGFGGGDIKFMACLGLWLGIKNTFLAMLICFILGGIGAAVLILLKKKTLKDKFPYGPYIAMASFITLLYGDSIVAWYWNWAFQVK